MVGRTQVFVDQDVEVSIVNPQQYRGEVLRLFAKEVREVTSALGPDYRVVVNGIDKPVEWARSGLPGVAIYIPCKYTVVPTSSNGIYAPPDY